MGGAPAANPNTTQTVTQKTELPQWYQSYLQNVMGKAQDVAATPYQAYSGQKVAGFTPDQLAAQKQVETMQGAATPYFNAANDAYKTAGGVSSLAAAQPYLNAATNTDFAGAAGAGNGTIQSGIGQLMSAGSKDTASAAQPLVGQGSALLGNAAGQSTLGLAQPYVQASTMPGGLMAASPYLSAASSGATPGAIASYMNPYNDAVTNRIAQLGARNLQENLLPTISDDFVRAGGYGSTRQRDLIGRAVRDTQESILGQQAQALQSGYTQSGQQALQAAGIQGSLAGTAGQLGTAQQQALLGAGTALANVGGSDIGRQIAAGQSIGQFGLGLSSAQAADAARQLQAGQGIGALGVQQGQLGLSAAQAASNAQLQAAVDAGQMTQADAARLMASGQAQQGLGTAGQTANLQQTAALQSVGQAQQQLGQTSLDSAYQDFLNQRNYPQQQTAFLQSVIQGLPVNTSSYQSATGPATTGQLQPSAAGQAAGIGMGIAGLSGLLKAKGGAVRRPKAPRGLGSVGRAA